MKILPREKKARLRLVGLLVLLLALSIWRWGYALLAGVVYQPEVGDLLFQSLPNPPGQDIVDAIEGCTNSDFSHCGVVVKKGKDWYVLEGMVPTVQEIPLRKWLLRGKGRFAAYRLQKEKRAHIPAWIESMREQLGLVYDFRYRMSDEEIYCSELPYDGWLAVTGEEMGQVRKLGDLPWQPYREVILKVEGSDTVPVEREMITPRDLAAAPQLELVVAHGVQRDR
ncbi:YiiX/YebB-like N1pC/P60 family cysteine hydrolase [Roseibacillus ishigakijimensis]|uniref:Permuted papain-like amidase enzyme, YaeF/YiiX, C92 family n=1 Tax=Roseibacillus ishigakijimensis TaxID=454146 RepID=A0A934RTI6_9BACT|nr:YiiX/YebB-like N1pC/P60 family cysteine hydrolase [Roseibacillus ishigakijimensis]MBK1834231.1 hypothetical protein [Roseibacillus ishigakijimensis]